MLFKKPNLKNAFVTNDWVARLQAMAAEGVRRLFGLTHGWQNNRNTVQNNFRLGLEHFERGNISDAIFRFRFVTMLDKSNAQAWYYLGRSYIAENKRAEAVGALKKSLEFKPGDEEALYMMAIAMGTKMPANRLPKTMPLRLSQEHFQAQAESYTLEQLETFQYHGHEVIEAAVRKLLVPDRVNYKILDLGVGTGLAGARLRDVAGEITGVDFSQNMIDQANQLKDEQGNKVYDSLVLREVHEYLEHTPAEAYDVVIAANLASYVGGLHRLAELMVRVTKPEGIIVMTADTSYEETGYRFLTDAGRFGFSEAYLQEVLAAAGIKDAKVSNAELYTGYEAWLCVARKT